MQSLIIISLFIYTSMLATELDKERVISMANAQEAFMQYQLGEASAEKALSAQAEAERQAAIAVMQTKVATEAQQALANCRKKK